MKFKCVSGLIALVLTSANLFGSPLTQPAQGDATNNLALQTVVSEVLSNNPSLKAAWANWEAMKERIPQARAWEDPRAGLDVNAGRFVRVPQNSFTDQKLMVEQALPFSGQNRLRREAANAEVVIAFEELHRRQLDAITKTRTTYYRWANAGKQLELNQKNAALWKQFVTISRSKYEVGTHSEADVLSAETELAKLEEAAFDFQREIHDAQSQLITLMDRPSQSLNSSPVMPDFAPVHLTLEKIEGLAMAHRPELFMAEQKVIAAQARLKAAHRQWIPEPSLRVEGDRYNGASQAVSEVSAGFSINLPWFNRTKYQSAIRENEKIVERASHELEAIRSETLGAVRNQLKQVETFHHHMELFQSKLLPLAGQTVTTKRLNYETDKASFLELLTAQQTVQDVESMYWDHLVHYEIALAELESLVGTPLTPEISSVEHQHNSK